MANYDEKMVGQADRLSGHPDSVRTEKTVESETRDMDMHIHDPMTAALDSNKGFMGKAVDHLNRETQRGEHAPVVGGYKHDHTMR